MRMIGKYLTVVLAVLMCLAVFNANWASEIVYDSWPARDTSGMASVGRNFKRPKSKLEYCRDVSPILLGAATPINLTAPTWEELEHSDLNVTPGGVYTPPDCTPRESIVLVIPYRDREEHLRTMLRHIHPFLQRQQAHYAILVVEETRTPLFNKGITMNIGFLEAVKSFDPDCVIFHDVDQLPEDDRNTYRCEEKAVHLAVQLSQLGHRLFYPSFFGGAIALTPAQFRSANGFSTEYYGWGQEDDDMLHRLQASGMDYTRHSENITFYASMTHDRDKEFVENPGNDLLHHARLKDETNLNLKREGLNTTRYTVKEKIIVHPLYIYIKAEAETPLANYGHATDGIPCLDDYMYVSKCSLVKCSAACNNMGQDCVGFVYHFNKTMDYRCVLKGEVCAKIDRFDCARFFPKIF